VIGTFICVPVEALTDPPNGLVTHFKDYWWVHVPGKGIVFHKVGRHISPLGNPNEIITKTLFDKFDYPPGAEVLLVEHVFVRTNHEGELRLPKVDS
jgi:hypothetical protein